MTYKKYKADLLFDGFSLHQNKVLITNEKGIIEGIVDADNKADDVQILHGLLSPGFINCHCHLELSHLKDVIPRNTGLVDFIYAVVTKRFSNDEEIVQAIENAEQEMIANGIVAVGDICNNTSTIQQKKLNNLAYYNFIEVSGWHPDVAHDRFKKSEINYKEFDKIRNLKPEIRNAFAPHAPYSVSENLWKLLGPTFYNNITTIHNQETSFENDFFKYGTGDFNRMYRLLNIDNSFFNCTGKTSLQSVAHHFNNAKNVLLVHNTFITEQDIEILNLQSKQYNQQFFYCLCVKANTYIENALPPIVMLKKWNTTLVIGTDSLASNDKLCVLDEIKKIKQHFPEISLVDMLKWATINGAKALQFEQRLGSFERGKQPGIILIDGLQNGELSIVSTVKKIV